MKADISGILSKLIRAVSTSQPHVMIYELLCDLMIELDIDETDLLSVSNDSGLSTKLDKYVADRIIEVMNRANIVDEEAITNLMNTNISCSFKFMDDPTIKLSKFRYPGSCEINLLSILNGIAGVINEGDHKGKGYIIVGKDDQKVTKFKRADTEK